MFMKQLFDWIWELLEIIYSTSTSVVGFGKEYSWCASCVSRYLGSRKSLWLGCCGRSDRGPALPCLFDNYRSLNFVGEKTFTKDTVFEAHFNGGKHEKALKKLAQSHQVDLLSLTSSPGRSPSRSPTRHSPRRTSPRRSSPSKKSSSSARQIYERVIKKWKALEREKEQRLAGLEWSITNLLQLLKTEVDATKTAMERKQTLTLDELGALAVTWIIIWLNHFRKKKRKRKKS